MKFNALFKRMRFAHAANLILQIILLILKWIGKTDQRKIIMRINLTIILLAGMLLQVSAAGYAQMVTLMKINVPLQDVIREIRKQTGYDFVYTNPQMRMARPVTISIVKGSLADALEACFEGQPLTYSVDDKTIIVKNIERIFTRYVSTAIRGRILDEAGDPIPGASIRIKGTNSRPTVSNGNGEFMIIVPKGDETLLISYIGYKTQEIKLKQGQTILTIKMVVEEQSMKDVVITGTGITRNKNSFTGATATFNGNDLKAIGNNNVIQSLRTLDPSFILLENNIAGANPNVLPNIEVRGKSGVPQPSSLKDRFASDPNQPLFILDGFEITLQTIVDLDINRVGSVTILKDAASTALYGARASNGVVVIETLRPATGPLKLTYTNDFRVEMPDLSVYNMMNAREKLEFEVLAGRYQYFTGGLPYRQLELDQLYSRHLAEVERGVDSYWLNEPVQTGFSENNSIFAEGGDQTLTYGVGLNYKTQSGAMKGSGRNTWSGSINLNYNKNKVSLYNTTYIRGYKGTDSPFGSFQNFVNANPYYEKNPDQRYLEHTVTAQFIDMDIPNPLYNGLLKSENTQKNMEVQNNFRINYKFTPEFSAVAALQMVKGSTTVMDFKSPDHTDFDNVSILQRGSYNNEKADNFSYQSNLLLTYGKVFAAKHSVTANARGEITNDELRRTAFSATGFPEGSTSNPAFAYNYKANSAPSASSRTVRRVNATISLNYSYDTRYLFDFSYRVDGSTAFGSAKQFSPYWSTGLGWNLKNEAFAKNQDWIDRVKIYANIGVTGNQNYANVTELSLYKYNSNEYFNQFGQAVTLSSLYNNLLDPQKTTQISGGTEYAFFGNRLIGYVNGYQKYTDPLVVPVNLPSSTGVYNYAINVGTLRTRGIEFKNTYAIIQNKKRGVIWNLGVLGSFYKSKYAGFGNTLAGLNNAEEKNKTLNRYYDGASPDDLWALKSLGIDPATGREMFLTDDGQYTFDPVVASLQAVGNSKPVIEGVISSNLAIKNFTVGINVRYLLGGASLNRALYEKVENISYQGISKNQDKRALYDRWKVPGDISQFKGISQTATTPLSSRFVQKENTFSGESINLGYNFGQTPWLKKMGLSGLGLTAIANDIFRLSTIRRERGTDYPFANTVSMSLRATF